MMTAVSSQTSAHDLGIKPTFSASVATVGDFFQLMKPRVMSLVVFTSFAGMYLAPVETHLGLALVSLFAIAAGAGASGAINQWYDKDIDRIMLRTRERPIPAGRRTRQRYRRNRFRSFCAVIVLICQFWWGLLASTIFFCASFTSVKTEHTAKYRY